MKKLFLMALIAMLSLSITSCKSDKGKATDVVKELSDAVKAQDAEKIAELYPDCGNNILPFVIDPNDSIEVSEDGTEFYVVVNVGDEDSKGTVTVKKEDEKFSILRTSRIIKRTGFRTYQAGAFLLEKVGLLKYKDLMDMYTDDAIFLKIQDLVTKNIGTSLNNKGALFNYLLNKYPKAQLTLQTVSIRKEKLAETLFVYVVYTGCEHFPFKATATVYDSKGNAITAETNNVTGPGSMREETTFFFEENVIGSANDVRITYTLRDVPGVSENDIYLYVLNKLGDYVSKNDYKEYLAQKKK